MRARWLWHSLVGCFVVLTSMTLASGVPLDVASADAWSGSGVAAPQDVPDRRVTAGECALLGRSHTAGQGCERLVCVEGAVPEREGRGAEVCRRRGAGGGPYATAVPRPTCLALNRRWVDEVNWCASNPRRDRVRVRTAAQCQAPFTTYVTHDEVEGAYDECLRPARARELARLAADAGRSFEQEAALRSPVLCLDRPQHVFTDGLCVPGVDPGLEVGGELLVGDSIAWRGGDELAALAPGLTIDGYPGRRYYDLAGRLDRYRAFHGDPTGVILELGTNRSRRFSRDAFDAVIASLPGATTLMLVLPYRATRSDPESIAAFTTEHAGWMLELAQRRPATCVADWRAVVRDRPNALVDGVHPSPSAERFWARWIADQWQRCVGRTP